jgi:hypothetical protein
MFIGDGAKLVRDCFALAKEKAPAIIFIDELDAVGTKRFDSEKSGDREVQRTMLELLNQLDGFASDDRIKVLAATNRVDVLDPALLRSGRLDRKIEFPLPNEEARAQILKIHSRKMKVDPNVNWAELARSTDEFGGAQLKAVCVEAGMIALRMGKTKIGHEHYVDAITEVQAKKKEVSSPSCETPSPELWLTISLDGQLLRVICISAKARTGLETVSIDEAAECMITWSTSQQVQYTRTRSGYKLPLFAWPPSVLNDLNTYCYCSIQSLKTTSWLFHPNLRSETSKRMGRLPLKRCCRIRLFSELVIFRSKGSSTSGDQLILVNGQDLRSTHAP